jgi:hypothetical protein
MKEPCLYGVSRAFTSLQQCEVDPRCSWWQVVDTHASPLRTSDALKKPSTKRWKRTAPHKSRSSGQSVSTGRRLHGTFGGIVTACTHHFSSC